MYLGIDLGTSNSAIFGNERGALRLFKTVDGGDVLPSAIMVDRRGNMHIGKKAYEQTAFSPENVALGFKRLMGTSSAVAFSATNRTMTPEEASAEVVKALLAQARMAVGDFIVEGAIVTIPAEFNQMQSEATMRAAAAAGLDKVGLLRSLLPPRWHRLRRLPTRMDSSWFTTSAAVPSMLPLSRALAVP
jgi:molecular chaperone DnaK